MQSSDNPEDNSSSMVEEEAFEALEELSTDLPVPVLTLLRGLAAVLSDDDLP